MPHRAFLRVVFLLAASFVASNIVLAPSAEACLQETLDYPTVRLREFSGRLVPPTNGALLPSRHVTFQVWQKGREAAEPLVVAVEEDGDFHVDLKRGLYVFKLQVEDFSFTLVGQVRVSRLAKKDKQLVLEAPWC
jgi:hypothetical protein